MACAYPKNRRIDYPTEFFRDETKRAWKVNLGVDPWNWLEDPNLKRTMNFVEEQNRLTEKILELYEIFVECDPEDTRFRDLLRVIYQSDRQLMAPLILENGYIELSRKQWKDFAEVYKIGPHVTQTIYDPNLECSEDQYCVVRGVELSPNKRYLAIGKSINGSEYATTYIIDLQNRSKKLNTLRTRGKWLITFHPSSEYFLYSDNRMVSESLNPTSLETRIISEWGEHAMYLRKIGNQQETDNSHGRIENDPRIKSSIFPLECSFDGKYGFTIIGGITYYGLLEPGSLTRFCAELRPIYKGELAYIHNIKKTIFFLRTNEKIIYNEEAKLPAITCEERNDDWKVLVELKKNEFSLGCEMFAEHLA